MTTNQKSLKVRFIEAVIKGELGVTDDIGTIVTLKQFRQYFYDIKSQYVQSFLPAATIEPGMTSMTHTKFVFRIAKGVYRVHPGVFKEYEETSNLTNEH